YAFVNGYSGRNVTAPLAVALLAGPVGGQALFERLVGDRTAGVWRQVIVRGSVDLRLPQRAVVAALAFGSILACLIYNDRVESAIERLDVLSRRDLGTRYANDLLERHVVPRAKPGDVLATNYNVADRLPQLSRLSVRITPGYNPEALLKLASQVPDRQLFVF